MILIYLTVILCLIKDKIILPEQFSTSCSENNSCDLNRRIDHFGITFNRFKEVEKFKFDEHLEKTKLHNFIKASGNHSVGYFDYLNDNKDFKRFNLADSKRFNLEGLHLLKSSNFKRFNSSDYKKFNSGNFSSYTLHNNNLNTNKTHAKINIKHLNNSNNLIESLTRYKPFYDSNGNLIDTKTFLTLQSLLIKNHLKSILTDKTLLNSKLIHQSNLDPTIFSALHKTENDLDIFNNLFNLQHKLKIDELLKINNLEKKTENIEKIKNIFAIAQLNAKNYENLNILRKTDFNKALDLNNNLNINNIKLGMNNAADLYSNISLKNSNLTDNMNLNNLNLDDITLNNIENQKISKLITTSDHQKNELNTTLKISKLHNLNNLKLEQLKTLNTLLHTKYQENINKLSEQNSIYNNSFYKNSNKINSEYGTLTDLYHNKLNTSISDDYNALQDGYNGFLVGRKFRGISYGGLDGRQGHASIENKNVSNQKYVGTLNAGMDGRIGYGKWIGGFTTDGSYIGTDSTFLSGFNKSNNGVEDGIYLYKFNGAYDGINKHNILTGKHKKLVSNVYIGTDDDYKNGSIYNLPNYCNNRVLYTRDEHETDFCNCSGHVHDGEIDLHDDNFDLHGNTKIHNDHDKLIDTSEGRFRKIYNLQIPYKKSLSMYDPNLNLCNCNCAQCTDISNYVGKDSYTKQIRNHSKIDYSSEIHDTLHNKLTHATEIEKCQDKLNSLNDFCKGLTRAHKNSINNRVGCSSNYKVHGHKFHKKSKFDKLLDHSVLHDDMIHDVDSKLHTGIHFNDPHKYYHEDHFNDPHDNILNPHENIITDPHKYYHENHIINNSIYDPFNSDQEALLDDHGHLKKNKFQVSTYVPSKNKIIKNVYHETDECYLESCSIKGSHAVDPVLWDTDVSHY